MTQQTSSQVIKVLKKLADPERAKSSAWFFKTAPGQYGCGDTFMGITVPVERRVAREFKDLPLIEVEKLLESKFHECRFVAIEILVVRYEGAAKLRDRSSERGGIQKTIYKFYLAHTAGINNWDLVDTSASYIVGEYLLTRKSERKILYKLAKSKNLWERRIAIVSTARFIAAGEFTDTIKIAELLLHDRHDLIHKAVGWMLREVGKRSVGTLEKFLKKHAAIMPRTMLRYAIEKMPPEKRKFWLAS